MIASRIQSLRKTVEEMAKDVNRMDMSQVYGGADVDNDIQQQNIDVVNKNLVETHIRLLGDCSTISQIIQLIAYIRHVVQNNQQKDLTVRCCRNVINTPLAMDVNGQEVKDYVPKAVIEIN